MLGAVFGLAFLIGPFIAGVMLHYLSWNFLFIVNLPISAILMFYSLRLLPNKSVSNVTRIDWKGIISLGLGLAGFTYGINNIDGNNIQSLFQMNVTVPFAVALVSFAFLLLTEKNTPSPIIKFGFFRQRQIIIVGILAMATGLIQACFVFLPKFVVQNFQVEPSTASFMLVPFVLASAVGSPVFGRLIDKYGVKYIIMIGLLLMGVGFYLMSVTGTSLFFYYLNGTFIGLGMSVLSGSSLRYIMLTNIVTGKRTKTEIGRAHV